MIHPEQEYQLIELLKLKSHDQLTYLLSVLALQNLDLQLVEDGDGFLIYFSDQNGKLNPVSTTEYLQALNYIAGFVVTGPQELYNQVKDRKDRHERKESANKQVHAEIDLPPEAGFEFFNPALLERVVDNITAQTLKKITHITSRQVDLFLESLRSFNLKPRIEFMREYVLLVFENTHGALSPLPLEGDIELFLKIGESQEKTKAWEKWRSYVQAKRPSQLAGFVVHSYELTGPAEDSNENTDKSASLIVVRKAVEQATSEYKNITGIENAFFSLPYSAQKMRDFIKAFTDTQRIETQEKVNTQTYIEQKPDFKKKIQAPIERLRKKESIKNQTVSFLNPLLSNYGIQVLDAKELIHAGHAEAIAANVLDTSLPFPLVDLLFVSTNNSALELEYISIFGWEKDTKNPDEPSTLIPYGNVCGIVIIPDSMPLKDRKRLIRQAALQLSRSFPTRPKPMILTVSPNLLEKWKTLDTVVLPEEEAKEQIFEKNSPKKAVDYGFYNINKNAPPEVFVSTYEPISTHIGGTQISVIVDRGDGIKNVVYLDYGWIFDLVPSWSTLGAMPAPVDGIAPFLRSNMFDMTRRLYRLDLILASINDSVVQTVMDISTTQEQKKKIANLEEFLLLEAYHRLGEEAFVDTLRLKMPHTIQTLLRRNKLSQLLAYLDRRKNELYAQKTIFDMVALSHAHQDHTLGIALLNPDIPVGWSAITRALCLADHRMASNWLAQDVAFVKLRGEEKVGSAYQVQERAYYLFNDADRVEVSPGVFITALNVKHSIPGSMGFIVDVEHFGRRVARIAYPGDYKDGHFFEEVGKRGGTDFLFVEGTNPQSVKKGSRFITEQIVADKIDEDFKKAEERNDLLVIDAPKNSIDRVSNILELAQKHGRMVLFSPKILRRIGLMNLALPDENILPQVQPNNPIVGAWKPQKNRFTKDELESLTAYGSFDKNQILENPTHFVIIRENEQPTKLEGLGQQVTWIDSTYGAYDQSARNEKRDKKSFADQQNWTFIGEGRHASGHTPVVRGGHPEADSSAAAKLHLAKATNILPIHTQRPGEIADTLMDYIDPLVTRIIRRRDHPRAIFKVSE